MCDINAFTNATDTTDLLYVHNTGFARVSDMYRVNSKVNTAVWLCKET